MKIFFFAILLICVQMTFAQPREEKGVAVYLIPGVNPQETDKVDLAKLKPGGPKIFDQNDILYYRLATHEFKLDFTAAERLRKDQTRLRGRPFAVFVGNRAVYAGAFWTSIWSQSFDGVFIDLAETKPDYPLLAFRTGYPNLDYFKGADRRGESVILDSLEKAGKLYDELRFVVKCKDIVATGKRRASFIFTFDIIDVLQGSTEEKELTLEIFDGKLLPELDANMSFSAGKEIQFNRDREIVLNYITQRGAAKPDRIFIDFRKK